MKSLARALTFVAALVLLILPAPPAQAQSRTWVSGVGDDAQPCSRTLPCKTFAGAIGKTATGGEINCLDPGSFGQVTITKAISIVCDEEIGHILAPATDGITVNAPDGSEVVLRGLDIDGGGISTAAGLNGISFIGGGSLHVQEVLIRDFSRSGINFAPASGTAKLHVSDETLISACGFNQGVADATKAGITVRPSGGNAVVTINGVQLRNNSNGILEDATGGSGLANVHVRDTVAASSELHGMSVTTGATHAGATIDRSTFLFNGLNGLSLDGTGAVAIIGSSTISGNVTLGVGATSGATLLSWKDNHIGGNASDGTPIAAFPGPGGALQ